MDLETPPRIVFDRGQYWLEVIVNGEQHRAPLGDGRYFAEMVFARIVAPAISPRRTDVNRKPLDRIVRHNVIRLTD